MYARTIDLYKSYWRLYGGWKSLLSSLYFHVALVVLALTYGTWSVAGWWDGSISVLTSLLSFSLAGYAMIMAFGDKVFFSILSRDNADGKTPPFKVINSTFFHFIFVQVLGIFWAIIAKSNPMSSLPPDFIACLSAEFSWFDSALEILRLIFWGGGFFLMLYSLSLALAATAAVFKMIEWYGQYAGNGSDKK